MKDYWNNRIFRIGAIIALVGWSAGRLVGWSAGRRCC